MQPQARAVRACKDNHRSCRSPTGKCNRRQRVLSKPRKKKVMCRKTPLSTYPLYFSSRRTTRTVGKGQCLVPGICCPRLSEPRATTTHSRSHCLISLPGVGETRCPSCPRSGHQTTPKVGFIGETRAPLRLRDIFTRSRRDSRPHAFSGYACHNDGDIAEKTLKPMLGGT